ncbi:hypothetical protein QNI19_25930 [Cytophagaceae bacterium DM2B3-1]|uniref:Lipoprotein n=1 Tax=Xanthocytophaga flava TaxID=3048013 RepID=A0ABT7CRP6_9BACT|nr:hypothetical protein [Xanthocytophaga flavus]MDJ1468623.1 hypothetical protein [Xanthocytophaga flavus]MDJ1496403.1 hypothetical protein [Xanthocytophaga flavus]
MKYFLLLCLVLPLFLITSCSDDRNTLSRSWRIMKVEMKDIELKRNSKNRNLIQDATIQDKLDSIFKNTYIRLYERGDYAILFQGGDYVSKNWTYDYKTEQITLVGNTPMEEYVFKKIDSGNNWMQVELTLPRDFNISADSPEFIIGKVALLFSEDHKYEEGEMDLLDPHRNEWRRKPHKKATKEEIRKSLVEQLSYILDYFQLVEDKKQSYFEPRLFQSPLKFYSHGLGVPSVSAWPERSLKIFYDQENALTAQQMLGDALNSTGDYPRGKNFIEEYKAVIEKMRLYLEN